MKILYIFKKFRSLILIFKLIRCLIVTNSDEDRQKMRENHKVEF